MAINSITVFKIISRIFGIPCNDYFLFIHKIKINRQILYSVPLLQLQNTSSKNNAKLIYLKCFTAQFYLFYKGCKRKFICFFTNEEDQVFHFWVLYVKNVTDVTDVLLLPTVDSAIYLIWDSSPPPLLLMDRMRWLSCCNWHIFRWNSQEKNQRQMWRNVTFDSGQSSV